MESTGMESNGMESSPQSTPKLEPLPPPPEKSETQDDNKKEGKKTGKGGNKGKKGKAVREYLGWESANDIEWRTEMEFTSWKNWQTKFGPETEWGRRYEEWICSGINRGAMRKPSHRALDWLKYRRGIEVAPVGECRTRNPNSVKERFIEPTESYCCRPCPWPKTTNAEVGWLAQCKSCQLEIYPNDFMKKPPLLWHQKKISSFMPGNL